MKLIKKLKSIVLKKNTQENAPPNAISTLREPFTTRNNKNADNFTKNSRMARSNKPKEIYQKCGSCNHIGHYQNSRIFPMADKTMNIKYIQDYSQAVPVTPNPSIFINI